RSEGIEHDYIIFLSRHVSKEKRKTLTAHSIGNWNEAKLGGIEGKAPPTNAIIMKETMNILLEKTKELGINNYEVTMEATHHGPLINTPSMFIETGGSIEEWEDPKAIEVLTLTIKELLKRINNGSINYDKKTAIAVG